MTTPGLQLGAPGVYQAPLAPDRSLRPVRLDVAGFVGVAPRGPVDSPTLVRSWSDYQQRFGGFEGSGRLPYAVSVFFDQGGERAYIVRVGPPGPRPAAEDDRHRALLQLQLPRAVEPVRFVAANPGVWGNLLSVRLEFDATPQFPLRTLPPTGGVTSTRDVRLPDGLRVPAGSLLRLRGPGLAPAGELRWVDSVVLRGLRPGQRLPVAVLDRPVSPVDTDGMPILAGVVTGTLVVSDGDPEFPRAERLTGLGLDPAHPRPLAATVQRESLLVRPVGDWTRRRLSPLDPLLSPVSSMEPVRRGQDVDELLSGTSFFDERSDLGLDDALDANSDIAPTMEEDPRRLRGATGAAHVAELGLLAVPDLLWAWLEDQPLPDTEPVAGSATFKDCAPPPEEITYRRRVKAILLDASTPAGLAEIVARQSRLVSLAEQHGRFVALLDVPQHLDARGIARWRASFNSSYCAAYHPWLGVLRAARMVGSAAPVGELVPPSSFAAGIIAARERRLGLPWGPGNELAAGAVIAAATVTAPEHDLLHPLGINVFRGERDGHRLTAARTLSTALHLRQLSVRRLLTMLRLAVERDMQWVVFEPSTPALRELIRHTLLVFLRELYRAGAFAGDTEVEAFFVRVDDSLNPPASIDLGRLIVEIGVAPVEPLEFLILRITRDGDGGVRVEEKTTDG